MSNDLCYYVFKIAFVGDVGVGKTAMVRRYCWRRFLEQDVNTLGVDYATKILVVDNRRIKLELWDTAGQERFRTITQSYYRNANALVLAYDITKYESFSGLAQWFHDIKRYASPNVLICLVGTKRDLESKREVTEEQARTLAEKYPNVIDVFETSSKEDVNVDKAIEKLVGALKNQYEGSHRPLTNSVQIHVQPKNEKPSSGKAISNLCILWPCCR